MEGYREEVRIEAAGTDFVEIVSQSGVPDIFIVRADCLPQLGAEWLVLQPDSFRADPTKGWEPIGGRFDDLMFVGSGELTAIKFRPDDPETICAVTSLGGEALEVQKFEPDRLELVRFLG